MITRYQLDLLWKNGTPPINFNYSLIFNWMLDKSSLFIFLIFMYKYKYVYTRTSEPNHFCKCTMRITICVSAYHFATSPHKMTFVWWLNFCVWSKSLAVVNWTKLSKSSRYVTVVLPIQLRKSLIRVCSLVILLILKKSLKVCPQYLNSKAGSFASWSKGDGNGVMKFVFFI